MKRFLVVLFSTLVILLLILLVVLLLTPNKKTSKSSYKDVESVETITEEDNTTYEWTAPNDDDLFPVAEGITWKCDKGNLKLFVDLVVIDPNRIYVYGEAHHVDYWLDDMRINKEIFHKIEENKYMNPSNDIEMYYDGNTLYFDDYRQGKTMPFKGIFELVKAKTEEPVKEAEVYETEEEEIESIENEEEIEVTDILSSTDNLISFMLDPMNERKEITVEAKYLESYPDYNGMKFCTLDGIQTFYVFGGKWTRENSVVTLHLIYRGYNKKYNGMEFSGYEYCFNLDSME